MRHLPVGPSLVMGAVLSLFPMAVRASGASIDLEDETSRQPLVAVDREVLASFADDSPGALLGPLVHARMPASGAALLEERLRLASLAAPFLPVGALRVDRARSFCTATWLGEAAGHTYVLTAAHCLSAANASAMSETATFMGWDGTVIAGGPGWAFIPPQAVGSAMAADIALLRLPTRSIPTDHDGKRLAQPLLYDGQEEHTEPLHFVGYGSAATWAVVGVGTRRWGRAASPFYSTTTPELVTGHGADRLRTSPVLPEVDWARTAKGDSGSAWWQRLGGYWSVTAVASRGTSEKPADGPRSSTSLGTRVALFIDWARGIYPELATITDRQTVTAAKPFVSYDPTRDVHRGTVHYTVPPQEDASGPVWPTTGRTGPGGPAWYSTIRVLVRNEQTNDRVEVRLRGRRAGCGVDLPMEDARGCAVRGGAGALTVSFHEEDNPTLRQGSYVGRFEVEAKGVDMPDYRRRFPVHVKLSRLVEGTLSNASPFIVTLPRMVDPQFVLRGPAGTAGPTAHVPHGNAQFGVIELTARDALQRQDHRIKLRVQRLLRCGAYRLPRIRGMEDRAPCAGGARSRGRLDISFSPADNAGLPAGLYRGKLWIQAVEGSQSTWLEMNLNIETLSER